MIQGEARRSFHITQRLVPLRPNGTDLSQILTELYNRRMLHTLLPEMNATDLLAFSRMTSALSLRLPSVYFRIIQCVP